MSDQDRGAYTPQREPPLQFDARRDVRDARPMPMALIASGAVLVLLIGGVIAAYAGVFRSHDDTPKTVGQPVVAMKTAPAADQQVAPDPAAKLEVLSDKPRPAAPTFTPAPETPAPRPTLRVQPSALPPVHIAPAESAPAEAKPKPAAVAATALPPPAARPIAATDLSTARAASTGPSKPAATTPVAKSGGAGAQIGAFSSRELADKGFADVGKLASTAGRGKRIEAVDHGGSVLYRTTVTGFADRDEAKAFCAALAAKGHACIVKG